MLAKRRIGVSRYSLAISSAISFASRLLGFTIVESAPLAFIVFINSREQIDVETGPSRRKRYRVRRMTKVSTPSASVDSTSS